MIEHADDILRSIALNGIAEESEATVKNIIGGNLSHILNLTSGTARLHSNVISRFDMILSQPSSLKALSSFEIRCSLCKKVISYPCWYYLVRYAVNHFHYFVCFDPLSSMKVTAKCFKR